MNNYVPQAMARIRGNNNQPMLRGFASFYSTPRGGVMVEVEVFNLPGGDSDFFGMHIHQYGNCTPPFDKTGDHYNPAGKEHPSHAGDLPPLLSNHGYAYMTFYDERFTIGELKGKSIVIHGGRDDFTSQPSGHSGDKIGCGEIILT